jgi:hypothetical protein
MHMEHDVLRTRYALVSLGDDGIVRYTISADADETLDGAREVIAATTKITKGKKCPVLADLRRVRSISREARQYYAGEESAQAVAAVALLVGSPISRMSGNFFLALNKPSFPVRLFTLESEAIEWLREFCERT